MSLANPTMDVLFEVLSGEDGCADHFPDKCCTLCAGWKHLIEHGYLSRGPEELARFKKAFHAQKRVPSGWAAQVEADAAERAALSKPPPLEETILPGTEWVHREETMVDTIEDAGRRARESVELLNRQSGRGGLK